MAAAQRTNGALSGMREGALDVACGGATTYAPEPAAAARCVGGKAEVMTLLFFLAAAAAQAPRAVAAPATAVATKTWPTREGDVVLKDFQFRSGEVLPELRMHYTSLGAPH